MVRIAARTTRGTKRANDDCSDDEDDNRVARMAEMG